MTHFVKSNLLVFSHHLWLGLLDAKSIYFPEPFKGIVDFVKHPRSADKRYKLDSFAGFWQWFFFQGGQHKTIPKVPFCYRFPRVSSYVSFREVQVNLVLSKSGQELGLKNYRRLGEANGIVLLPIDDLVASGHSTRTSQGFQGYLVVSITALQG